MCVYLAVGLQLPWQWFANMKTMVQAFVISRLDYCNALCYGITDELTRLNAAARLVTSTRRCDHISPMLRQLHWLPVRQRVVFKIATLIHQSLSSNAPGYLADDCPLVADARVRQLRSVDTGTLVVIWMCSSFVDRTFVAAGPQVWNSLPSNLRLCGLSILSYGQFRRLLETFLFGQWGHGAVWTVFNCTE